MEFDAFISHSSKDKTMADAVCAKLEQAGIRCWIAPRDVAPGKTWSGEIMRAIEGCKVMVLVFSSNANESAQIVREVETAVHQSKPILPLRIENILPSNEMAYFMNSVHWLDAISEPLDAHLDQLVQAVSALLGQPVLGSGPTLKDIPIPSPTPKPQPAFDWKPILYAVPGVVVLIVLLIFFLKSGAKPSAGVANSGGVVPAVNPAAAPSAGSVDPSMTGVWYFKTTIGNVPAMMTANYESNGNYKIETVITDSGTYQGSGGQWTTKDTAGMVQQGTYRYVGPHTLEETGPLGTAQWTDDLTAEPLDPNNPSGLGTWQATLYPPNSPPWNMTTINHPDGSYSSKADIVDQGTFTSANGQMSMTSHTTGATAVPCSYRSIDENTMEFTGPLGSAAWSRNQP